MKKYSYHSMLPVQLQSNLMSAAETKKLDLIDAAIAATMASAPNRYHTAKTLDQRVFFNEPRQTTTPMAGFIHPLPQGMSRI